MASPLRAEDFTFEPVAHEYRMNGVVVVSVTQALELAGLVDAEWFTEPAKRRGIAVHAACHYLDEGDLNLDTVDPAIEGYVRAYERFKEEARFLPGRIEERMYHPRLRYAGTPDRVTEVATETIPLACLDLKTGAPQPWHAEQTAGYVNMLADPMRYRRFCLYLRADGSYRLEEHKREHYPRDLARFLACLTVAQMRTERGLA